MYLIVSIILVVSVLLVLAVLIQNSKGGGLASQFTGAGAGQIMGVKRTGDFLENTTWVLVILLISFSLVSGFFLQSNGDDNSIKSVNVERAAEKGTIPGGINQKPSADTTKK